MKTKHLVKAKCLDLKEQKYLLKNILKKKILMKKQIG